MILQSFHTTHCYIVAYIVGMAHLALVLQFQMLYQFAFLKATLLLYTLEALAERSWFSPGCAPWTLERHKSNQCHFQLVDVQVPQKRATICSFKLIITFIRIAKVHISLLTVIIY